MSGVKKIEPKTIIELRKKNPVLGTLLIVEHEKTKKNKDGTVQYVPICLNDGFKSRLKLHIYNQIISSKAKSYSGDEKQAKQANSVAISFRKLSLNDLECSDYAENVKNTLLEKNHELCDALKIIADEYEYLCKNQVIPYDGAAYEIKQNTVINNFAQFDRKLTEDEKKAEFALPANDRKFKNKRAPLENAIFRIKLLAAYDDNLKRIGDKNFKTKKFEYTVFDVRKPIVNPKNSEKNNVKYSPAQFKNKEGKLIDLNVNNVGDYITCMSLISGIIDFDSVCISPYGLSLKNKFNQLYIAPHKPIVFENIDVDELKSMNLSNMTNNDADMIIEDEPNTDTSNDKKKNKSFKSNSKSFKSNADSKNKNVKNNKNSKLDADENVMVDNDSDNENDDNDSDKECNEPDENDD